MKKKCFFYRVDSDQGRTGPLEIYRFVYQQRRSAGAVSLNSLSFHSSVWPFMGSQALRFEWKPLPTCHVEDTTFRVLKTSCGQVVCCGLDDIRAIFWSQNETSFTTLVNLDWMWKKRWQPHPETVNLNDNEFNKKQNLDNFCGHLSLCLSNFIKISQENSN